MYDKQKVIDIKHEGVHLGWIVVDSFRNNMSFGGCRIINDLKQEEVQELSLTMTKKLLIHGLPIGGSKGGVIANAGGMELNEILLKFGESSRGILDNSIIIGKDLGATNERMAKIYEGVGSPQLTPVKNSFPDSELPLFLNGLKGYLPNMTALGVLYTALATLGKESLDGVRVAIQGAGAVGRGACFRFLESGATVVGISDIENCILNSSGIEMNQIEQGISNGLIDPSAFGNGKREKSADLLTVDCDILVLAAGSNTVSGEVAEKIKANYVIEGSNFGLMMDARETLFSKSVIVVPDIIASSSSAAMVCKQMGAGNSLEPEKLWADIKTNIFETTQACREISQSENLSIRKSLNDIYLPRLVGEYDFQWGAEVKL